MLDILVRDGRLPESLQNIFVEDVTESYTRVDDCRSKSPKRQTGNKTVYLSYSIIRSGFPFIGASAATGGVSVSNAWDADIVYLPVGFTAIRSGRIPVDDPFFRTSRRPGRALASGYIAPKKTSPNLPVSIRFTNWSTNKPSNYAGVRSKRADNPQFRNAETVLRFPEERVVMAGTDSVQSRKPYRYWRFCSSHEGRWRYGRTDFLHRRRTVARKTRHLRQGGQSKAKVQIAPAIHDDDALTFFCAQGNDYWGRIRFGKPVDISKILWFRRGDGNDVYPDYEYTLYYWGDRCWQAIGHQKAGSQTWLDFPNVPQNALLLLVLRHERNAEPTVRLSQRRDRVVLDRKQKAGLRVTTGCKLLDFK